MRATEGNHRLSNWRKLVGITAASALALSVLAGSVQGAQPGWPVGHGTNYLAPSASGASSTSITAGKTVGFYEWLHNPGPSNISQLFLNVTATPQATQVGVAWWIDAGPVQTCTINAVPLCSFGALNAGQTVYVLAAFRTDATKVSPTVPQGVSFDFNSTGIPPGGNNSHGDDRIVTDSVAISAVADGDSDGDFNFADAAGLTVQTAPVGGSNTQSTSLTVGGTRVGASVGDSPSLTPAKCTNALIGGIVAQNPWFSCKKLTSLTSALEVGNGGTFVNPNGGPGIKVVVSFASAPNQLNGAHPFAYHFFTDASGDHAELITATCSFVNGFPSGTTPSEGCLRVVGSSVEVWLFHNGGMRY